MVIRYAPTGGLHVRSAPAGSTVIVTLNYGDLMYDIQDVPSQTASLNGHTYLWIKVHCYYSTTAPCTEVEGWIAKELAGVVSQTAPTLVNAIFSNAHIKQHEELNNARIIFSKLKQNGWSRNAIYGALGNMEAESYINPGVYYDLNPSSNAYGLTQWNPKSKLLDWLSANNYSDNLENQLNKIIAEVPTNPPVQWMQSNHSLNISFSQYIVSTLSVSSLAECFLYCYEHPGNESSKTACRQANASKWATLLWYLGHY